MRVCRISETQGFVFILAPRQRAKFKGAQALLLGNEVKDGTTPLQIKSTEKRVHKYQALVRLLRCTGNYLPPGSKKICLLDFCRMMEMLNRNKDLLDHSDSTVHFKTYL